MNDVYQSNYQNAIYTPIYLPAIIFYDEEELEESEIAEA
jgi:hypothetical protein